MFQIMGFIINALLLRLSDLSLYETMKQNKWTLVQQELSN